MFRRTEGKDETPLKTPKKKKGPKTARRAKKRLQEPELRWRREPEYGDKSQETATRARAQVEKRARIRRQEPELRWRREPEYGDKSLEAATRARAQVEKRA